MDAVVARLGGGSARSTHRRGCRWSARRPGRRWSGCGRRPGWSPGTAPRRRWSQALGPDAGGRAAGRRRWGSCGSPSATRVRGRWPTCSTAAPGSAWCPPTAPAPWPRWPSRVLAEASADRPSPAPRRLPRTVQRCRGGSRRCPPGRPRVASRTASGVAAGGRPEAADGARPLTACRRTRRPPPCRRRAGRSATVAPGPTVRRSGEADQRSASPDGVVSRSGEPPRSPSVRRRTATDRLQCAGHRVADLVGDRRAERDRRRDEGGSYRGAGFPATQRRRAAARHLRRRSQPYPSTAVEHRRDRRAPSPPSWTGLADGFSRGPSAPRGRAALGTGRGADSP